jgi:O-antigen/teichoic acid export membrane protein
MSSRVAQNIAANFFGRGWGALLSIVLTPIYIELLGIEAYGLVGFFITLQAMLGVLDMGLGAAATREAAVLSAQADGARQIRNLMRTLEWIYWGVAAVIVLVIGLLAPPIARYWVNPQTLQPDEVRAAIILIGCVIGAQWPTSLYGGMLMGLQMQTSANVLYATFSTLRALGAVLVIQISPSVVSFFQWQVFVSVVQTIVTAAYLWKQVPTHDHKPRFDLGLLHQIKRFAAEMSGMTLMATAFMQLDKLVLSRVLTLEHFGYYFAAATAASGLYIIIGPIFAALFPRFSQLVGRGEEASIRLLYDRASQLMAAAVLPAMAVMVFFAEVLLMLWTRDRPRAIGYRQHTQRPNERSVCVAARFGKRDASPEGKCRADAGVGAGHHRAGVRLGRDRSRDCLGGIYARVLDRQRRNRWDGVRLPGPEKLAMERSPSSGRRCTHGRRSRVWRAPGVRRRRMGDHFSDRGVNLGGRAHRHVDFLAHDSAVREDPQLISANGLRRPADPSRTRPQPIRLGCLQIGADHLANQLSERRPRPPTELGGGLARVTEQRIDFGWAEIPVVDGDDALTGCVVAAFLGAGSAPRNADPKLSRRHLDEVSNAVLVPGCNDEVLRHFLLQHQPHRLDVVFGVAPVSFRVQIAEIQTLLRAELDLRQCSRDLSRDEILAANRRLVIEENSVACIHAIRFAVVNGDPVGV